MSVTHALLIAGLLGVLWSVYRLHQNAQVDFNMLDLLMENGRVSKVSCLVMGAFALHSWVIIDLQLNGKMTEGYMLMYSATWVAPLIVRLFNLPPPPEKQQ